MHMQVEMLKLLAYVVFGTLVILSKCSAHAVINSNMIVDFINDARREVSTPPASDIQRIEWNTELAGLAQMHADGCSLSENPFKFTQSFFFLGENRDVSMGVTNNDTYIQDVLNDWVNRWKYYDYSQNCCTDDVECDVYTQLMWAKTNMVGCGVAYCADSDSHFFVCNFYPRGNRFGRKPYKIGPQCTECVPERPGCDNGLCIIAGPDMMTGSDPHFSVRLPSGQLLCFTVQGEVGAIFNLISTDTLEMNARFIRLAKHPKNTWLGEIGITVAGKSLVFNATSGKVQVDNHTEVDSRSVEKIREMEGRLYLTLAKDGTKSNRVEVEIQHLGIRFSIVFVKNEHLDMLWISGGMNLDIVNGLLGQFLRAGVEIDKNSQLLIFPGERIPIPIKQQKLFSFVYADAPQYYDREEHCWTSLKPSSQAEGVIKGTYLDYEVNDLLYTGFNFSR